MYLPGLLLLLLLQEVKSQRHTRSGKSTAALSVVSGGFRLTANISRGRFVIITVQKITVQKVLRSCQLILRENTICTTVQEILIIPNSQPLPVLIIHFRTNVYVAKPQFNNGHSSY